MHILIAILGAIGGAAFWWYRAKHISEAANDVVDLAGRARGKYRRNVMKKKAAVAPVTAIDDPIVAAATVIMAIATEDNIVTQEIEERVRAEILRIADRAKADEAVIYAKWASDQVADVHTVIDKACDFLAGRLNETEKEELIAMVDAAAIKNERHPLYPKRIERLRKKLGLVVN
jgi:hypothetical protein